MERWSARFSGVDAEREAQIASLLAADPNLRYSAETGKFYKLVATDVTWAFADFAAQATDLEGVSGQLGTIRFSADEKELRSPLGLGELNDQIWLGGSDATVEGEWRWQEGGADDDQFWQGAANGVRNSCTPIQIGIQVNRASRRLERITYLFRDSAGNWQRPRFLIHG